MLLRYLVLVLFGVALSSCGEHTNIGLDNTPSPAKDPPIPVSNTMQEALQGTWCYYSAANSYPYYLGLIIDKGEFTAIEVYRSYVLSDGTINQTSGPKPGFTPINGSIDETNGLASISLVGHPGVDLTGLNNPAPLLFNGTSKNYIKMSYGPNKVGFFKKNTSDQSGLCPGLSVAASDLARLPQADEDGDGIPDFKDNCAWVANKDQVDADQDGWGDVCPICNDTPNLAASCSPEPDLDGDGIEDSQDNCPTVANSDQKDTDKNGIGDVCEAFNGSIKVPDGFSLYGTVEGQPIQVAKEDSEVSISVNDWNENGIIDKNEKLIIKLEQVNVKGGTAGSTISLSMNLYSAGSLTTGHTYLLEGPLGGNVKITFPNQEVQEFQPSSVEVYFTFFTVDKNGMIAGQFRIALLKEGKAVGELSGNFSESVEFVKVAAP